MSPEIEDIERALAALLTAAIDDDMRMIRDAPPGITARVFRLTDPIPSRAESEVRALVDQPIGAACRQAIRRLGSKVFEIARSVDGMREVAERAADHDPQRFGRRVAIIDSAWNGIGAGAEVWVS